MNDIIAAADNKYFIYIKKRGKIKKNEKKMQQQHQF